MPKILIVEDNRIDVRLLEHHLAKAGIQTLTTEEGSEALKLIRSERPDIVLLDLGLPLEDAFANHWDGFNILAWIHRQSEPRPAVIIITGQPECVGPRLLAQGASGFFTKPVKMPALIEMIFRITAQKGSLPLPASAEAGQASRPTLRL